MDTEELQTIVNSYIEDACKEEENLSSRQKEVYVAFKAVYTKNPLLHIVDALSFALTDIDVEKRAKGTGMLAECIHQCDPGSMDKLEIETLMKFFCDRMRDHHSIQPIVIYAFLGLLSYQNMNKQLIIDMIQSIFTEVHIQSLVQADRRNIFNIFSNLLRMKLHILKEISAEFVFGFIQAMDSEKDPRNLLLCFENSYLVLADLDTHLYTEDLFEILSCYFPVEFNEPKEVEFRIKKSELKEALKKCLTAEKAFAPYAIPLYLEKLSSDMMESKLDSLITFNESLKIFRAEDVALFVNDIWLLVRKDYLLSDYKELDAAYLDFVYNLIKCLSSFKDDDPLKDDDPVMTIIDFLIKDCMQTLKDPEMVISVQCGNVILHASNASDRAFNEITKKLITPLRDGFVKYTSVQQRTCMLEIVAKILSVENSNIVPDVSLLEFVDYLTPLLYELLKSHDNIALQVLSLQCLKCIVMKHTWWEHIDFHILAHHCFSPVFEKEFLVELHSAYSSFVKCFSEVFPEIYKEQYLDSLEDKDVQSLDKKIVSQCFELLENTSLTSDELANGLFSNFKKFIELSPDIYFRITVVKCYRNILNKSKRIVEVNYVFLPLLKLMKNTETPFDLELSEIASHLVSVSFRRLSTNGQKHTVTLMHDFLSFSKERLETMFSCSHLSLHAEKQLYLSAFLRGVLTQSMYNVLNEIGLSNIFSRLFELMENAGPNTLRNLAITFGSIVNKLPQECELSSQHLDTINRIIETNPTCTYVVTLLSWITKGLVLNWQPLTTRAITLLLDCLNNTCVAMDNTPVAMVAAEGFGVIVKDVELVFTKESHSVIKLMYKQRYTQHVLPLLIQRYYAGGVDVKSFHMIAISNTLQVIPKQLLQKHLKDMMPLLMHSLATCESAPITESTLATISSVLPDNESAILSYVPDLLVNLLKHITDSSMRIRMLALKSLALLSSYKTHVVLPTRMEVLRKVRLILNDKKRLVRKEAISCSNAWHLLGSGA